MLMHIPFYYINMGIEGYKIHGHDILIAHINFRQKLSSFMLLFKFWTEFHPMNDLCICDTLNGDL